MGMKPHVAGQVGESESDTPIVPRPLATPDPSLYAPLVLAFR